MKTILSIQSHVAFGYVGNRAAVFPLQVMGYEVIVVNTVQFSNHTGYGDFTGQVFEPSHIRDVLDGVAARGALEKVDAVLSGYLGNPALGDIVIDTVERIRKNNPDLVYCCDPVMGDTGRGFFVPPALQQFFAAKSAGAADIMTPNQFELAFLSGIEIRSLDDARRACGKLHEAGAGIILLTSLEVAETKNDEIQMMVSVKDGKQWAVSTPKLALDPAPNGAGDMTAAIFVGRILAGEPANRALENTAASVFGVFEKTKFLGQRELAIIPAQECFKMQRSPFAAKAL